MLHIADCQSSVKKSREPHNDVLQAILMLREALAEREDMPQGGDEAAGEHGNHNKKNGQ